MTSVFSVNHTHIDLKGKGSGNAGTFTGTAREAPGVSFPAKLTKISDWTPTPIVRTMKPGRRPGLIFILHSHPGLFVEMITPLPESAVVAG
jgi:hypothetical protein